MFITVGLINVTWNVESLSCFARDSLTQTQKFTKLLGFLSGVNYVVTVREWILPTACKRTEVSTFHIVDVDEIWITFTVAVVSAESIVRTIFVIFYRVSGCPRTVDITCRSMPPEEREPAKINCSTAAVSEACRLARCHCFCANFMCTVYMPVTEDSPVRSLTATICHKHTSTSKTRNCWA